MSCSKTVKIPETALSNIDIIYYMKVLKIPNCLGVFMKDELKKISLNNRKRKSQCAVVNLENSNQFGSHWVAYIIDPNLGVLYFDSFAQEPPTELVEYLGCNSPIQRNQYVLQNDTSSECGRLCLFILNAILIKKISYNSILQSLKIRYDENETTNKNQNKRYTK